MGDSNGVVCLFPLPEQHRMYVIRSMNYFEVLNTLIYCSRLEWAINAEFLYEKPIFF